MYLLVGLGNPGKKYENTRHNMGFITIDYMADKLDVKVNKIKHKSLCGETRIAGEKVVLMKPQTYMNLSGEAVREAMSFYKLSSENLIVVYDDVDLDTGFVRIRKKGSSGTHNGMRSVLYQLGTENFPRVRIGIGRGNPRVPLGDFVLSGFNKEEVPLLEEGVIKSANALQAIIENGIDKAMNMYNKK